MIKPKQKINQMSRKNIQAEQGELSKFEKLIKVTFKNKSLLHEALTHRSFLNEHPDWPTPHNERLEFLGDAVLELVTTVSLFNQRPSDDEGMLTSIRSALVNHFMLSQVAQDIKLDDFIRLSRGEARGSHKARRAILANAVEALIGAIYLDQGYEAARGFIERHMLRYLSHIMKERL